MPCLIQQFTAAGARGRGWVEVPGGEFATAAEAIAAMREFANDLTWNSLRVDDEQGNDVAGSDVNTDWAGCICSGE